MNNPLHLIRSQMTNDRIDAVIITDSDPHMSEYIATYWQLRQWLSGFTGSAGTLVITQDHAGLWTDSRYFIQAEEELKNSGFTLHRYLKPEDSYINWIYDNVKDRSSVGVDGRLCSTSLIQQMKKKWKKKKYSINTAYDAADRLWTEDRAALPLDRVFAFDIRYAGQPVKEKLKQVRRKMADAGVDWYLATALDEVAWLYNLRGRDVSYNPVFYAFALIGATDSYIFIVEQKLPLAVRQDLERDEVYIEPYQRAYALSDICHGTVGYDEKQCNYTLYESLNKLNRIHIKSPIQTLKAIKNQIQIQHIESAMIKDGIALVKSFYWLEQQVAAGDMVSEYDFAEAIAQHRSQQPGYFGESFPAIVGYQANGAIVHYRPKENESAEIKSSGILLCDSGAQFLDGTTDITRTISLEAAIGPEVQKAYTLVLKGHIQLAMAEFPWGTSGGQLDILARQPLWSAGLNFGHGTGHGVGYFLNVHEGPMSISPGKHDSTKVTLQPGMLISNEPGYYEAGEYGIRIENLILVKESEQSGFLRFDTMSLCPIDLRLVDRALMSTEEIDWLNSYHERVYSELSPLLDGEHQAWLKEKCRTL